MFRQRVKVKWSPSSKVEELEMIENENGEYVIQSVDQDKKLPEPEMFNLGNMLNAGIEPEEVDSKVLKAKTVNADTVVRKYTKKEKVNEETSDN